MYIQLTIYQCHNFTYLFEMECQLLLIGNSDHNSTVRHPQSPTHNASSNTVYLRRKYHDGYHFAGLFINKWSILHQCFLELLVLHTSCRNFRNKNRCLGRYPTILYHSQGVMMTQLLISPYDSANSSTWVITLGSLIMTLSN